MAIVTNWYFDIQEEGGPFGPAAYSIGPIELVADPAATVTVQQFITAVNTKFQEAYNSTTHLCNTLYELSVVGFGGNICDVATTPGQDPHDLLYVGIKYRISAPEMYSSPDFKFKFLWATGPNGTLQIDGGVAWPKAMVSVTNNSSVKAFVFPWNEGAVGMILDKAPIPPFVDLRPYKGINNKILIMLDGNIGDAWYRPVMIKDSDFDLIRNEYANNYGVVFAAGPTGLAALESFFEADDQLARINAPEVAGTDAATADDTYREQGPGIRLGLLQTHVAAGSPAASMTVPADSYIRINYRSDDPARTYEIYRISEKPTSYRDFDTPENPIQTITTELAPGKHAVPASYLDTVIPNTKYYYCFRCIDVHNHFSNPTIVYEAELVDNDGQVYFILKPYNFDVIIKPEYRKSGRKYIYIEPSVKQVTLLPDDQGGGAAYTTALENLLGAPTLADIMPATIPPADALGPGGTGTVWNKNFKIRVTSKKTGKKFDLNLSFKNTGVNIP